MNILTLDGGGSKGVYTLGILKELEIMLGVPLHKKFDFIYGTSTGAIIASLIALGYPIKEIEDFYFDLIPKVMKNGSAKGKTKALKSCLESIFKGKDFSNFQTGIGIIATNLDNEKPLIFKSDIKQAYKLKHSFIPGFGCTVAEAVLASCSAFPIFQKVFVSTENQGNILAIDGGFIGNNPILFAIADVFNALETSLENASFLSLGTGNFVEKVVGVKSKIYKSLEFVQLFEKILKSNANTTDILAKIMFKNLKLIRINESFNQPEYGTNMVEININKLRQLHRLGRNSFAQYEDDLRNYFG